MSVYVALLRGVNVGGKGRLAMAELRSLFEELGFSDVQTLIQSGNVVFESLAAPVAGEVEEAIKQRFEIVTPVLIRTAHDLERVVVDAPFPEPDLPHVHVGFMSRSLSDAELSRIDVSPFEPERAAIVGAEVYLFLPFGMGQSKLARYLDRRLGVAVTVRNWNTVNALVELATA